MTCKTKFTIFRDCPIFIFLLLPVIFSLLPVNLNAQIIDTAFVGETATYKVRNQQNASYLYWEVIGGDITSENPTQTDSVVVLWNNLGVHELWVYEQSEQACAGIITYVEIEVVETTGGDAESVLDIPNVFTPNEDNKNDYFVIGYNYPPESYLITIVNRWGNQVFETHDINYSWDGRTHGEYCTPGVYYWVMEYREDNRQFKNNGFVYLFR